MTDDDQPPLVGALERMQKTHFARLREIGIDSIVEENTDIPEETVFETDREEAMYLAGRISGLCEAQALLEEDTE